MAESVSFIIPYRNRPVEPLELALQSLRMQTDQRYDVVLVDISSNPEMGGCIAKLCHQFGMKHHRFDIPLPDREVEVDLWNTCFNYGARQAEGDIIIYTGMDRIYESNVVGQIINDYNNHLHDRRGIHKDVFIANKVWNLNRTPSVDELNDFDKLINEATWRGGYGYWGSSRKWIYDNGGLDESIRWYEDLDMMRRAKLDKLALIWQFKHCRVLHLSNHPVSRWVYRNDKSTEGIASRGKLGISRNFTIKRNDETWGMLTHEKMQRLGLP